MIKVGCCGFPVKREIYYQIFPVVEIQKSFYQLPQLSTGERWREEAPSGFEFTMKAWQLITHDPSSPTYRRLRLKIPDKKKKAYGFFKGTGEVEEAWVKTKEFALALGVQKIVFQTPASFYPSDEHIKNLRQFFKNIERHSFILIWEPRGRWEREEVERLCQELNLIPCLHPFEGETPKGALLYLRLHGQKGYRDSYSEEQMKKLINTGRGYVQAYLMFNNITMYEDALSLKRLLERGC